MGLTGWKKWLTPYHRNISDEEFVLALNQDRSRYIYAGNGAIYGDEYKACFIPGDDDDDDDDDSSGGGCCG